jgi:hypothetical protein
MEPEHALRIIDETQSLTRHYARHQRQKSGLGYALGGLVLLAVSLLALLLKPGPIPALSMYGFTLLWLIGKEALSNWLYMPLGSVKERWLPAEKRPRVLRTVVGTLLIAGILLPTLLQHPPDLLQLTFLAFFLLIVACTIWFCLRRLGEWLPGLLLLSISALTTIGSNTNSLQWLLLLSFIVALACIVLGVREHLQFRALIEQLQTHQQAALWKRYASSNSLTQQHPSRSQQQWPLFYVLTASIVSAFALTHLPFAAPFCTGTMLLLVLQGRTALQARVAPALIAHTTRRPSCSMISSTNHPQQ